ncbi:YhjD/YihY/BrkB family envelope integrity protein [Streptomyces sp. NPDC012637]|uniref:YhjD/YihY/BrkB family envelope integrity protein n=1 Tax=Streptomyces sp. NPDC012637 TaxID=3364842 RepID=UPI0036E82DE2
MRSRDQSPGDSRDDHGSRTTHGGGPPRGNPGRTRRAAQWGKAKYAGSWAENLWHRLDAVDFLNRAMLLAATLLLCAVPFMLIVAALAGRSAVSYLSERLGLNHEAAAEVGDLFASSTATTSAVTGLSWAFFILGGIASASAFQTLYQQVFEVRPHGARDRLRALVWLAGVVAWTAAGTSAGHELHAAAPVAWWIVNIPASVAFWWLTMRLLLGGEVAWRRLLPCAVATGGFWVSMLAVFHFVFSDMVISNDQKYGPIGVVFALMSFFIAIGVVITLGAAVGMMWHDRGMSFRAAVKKMRRAS